MILPLPKSFDENEWFILLGLVCSYTAFFSFKKDLPRDIIVILMVFGTTIARILDHVLATARYDFYTIVDQPQYEVFDLLIYFLYAPFAYFFIHFYVKWKIKGMGTIVYLLSWSTAGTCFEWVCAQFHIFQYHGWKMFYSFTSYFTVQILTILIFSLLVKMSVKQINSSK